MSSLLGIRVVEAGDGVACGYAGKLLADQGAEVVKIEESDGDPLRTWSAARPDQPTQRTGALFSYLAAGKTSAAAVDLDGVDVVLAGENADQLLGAGWRDICRSSTVVVDVTPFGLDGPLAGRASTEFTLQAWCGLISACGTKETPPLQMGIGGGEWATGATAALAALAGLRMVGGQFEVAALEVMAVCLTNYPSLYRQFTGQVAAMSRGGDWPSVVQCRDGWIGLCIFTAQQWADFASMIGRPELGDDERLNSMGGRSRNRELAESVVRPWLAEHDAAEIHELGGLFRVPVAFIGNGRSLFEMSHLIERNVFVGNPGGFEQPRPPFIMSGSPVEPIRPAPALRSGPVGTRARSSAGPRAGRPLDGVTVLDLTAFWAGPYATHLMSTLGADVLKVESPTRPDGMRYATVATPTQASWLEFGPTFHGTNPGKRSVSIDFSTPSGRDLVLRLLTQVDVVVENFTPRVLSNVGLAPEVMRAANPALVVLRMPGFGLDGPWRDHAGFAQTMEQASGIGWLTGLADAEPLVRSTIDPIAGIHGAFAVLAALEHRRRTGEGQVIEMPMLEVALNIAAEPIVTWSAEKVCLERDGNRGPRAAPQGVYPCAGTDMWIALAVATDEHWAAVVDIVDRPEWSTLDRSARRARHDELDRWLADWFVGRDRDDTVSRLLDAGVPAAPVWDQNQQDLLPQLVARGFNQSLNHAVVGNVALPGIGIRATGVDLSYRSAAPTVGDSTDDVLRERLGLTDGELHTLREDGAIGPTRPDVV